MIHVDLNSDGSGTLERYKKKSYEWYRRVTNPTVKAWSSTRRNPSSCNTHASHKVP